MSSTRRRITRARIRYNKMRRWYNRLADFQAADVKAAHYASNPDFVTRCWRPRRLTRKRVLAAIGAPHWMDHS